jgi:phospholipid-binding lipoprotein MlaA
MKRDWLHGLLRWTVSMSLVAALAACASSPPGGQAEGDDNDPIELVNRNIFAVNQTVDMIAIRPVAQTYKEWAPEPVKTGVRNLLNYLRTPVNLANDLLQADGPRAGTTISRFAMNTMSLGLVDIAKDNGLPYRRNDFGATLYRWGVGEGPYLVLPIAGPSNARDAVGLGVDVLMDPLNYVFAGQGDLDTAMTWGRYGANGVDVRANTIEPLDDVERGALDFYATVRSLSRQVRNEELKGVRPSDKPPSPSLTMRTSTLP